MVVNTSSFLNCLQKLYAVNRARGMRFDCEGIKRLLVALHHPEKRVAAIHVAGTNGKGSVSTKIAAGLQAAGLKTGLYTSPHISSFRERIRIDGEMISEEAVCEHLLPLFEHEATFFEYVTAMAFAHFAKEKVDRAVLEVGLGGRLDATNVCSPLLTVITSISMDHTAELGDTLEAITREKAGIIKPLVPILIGPRVPREIVEEIAGRVKAPLTQVQGNFSTTEEENRRVAEQALRLLGVEERFIRVGLTKLPPCRFEILETKWGAVVLDVAHNPDGIERLLERLKKSFPAKTPFTFIYGASQDKDFAACLERIEPFAHRVLCVQADSPRAASTAQLASCGAFEEASSIEAAIERAAEERGVTVIVGTFFIMSRARQFLGIQEPRDPLDLNEANRQK